MGTPASTTPRPDPAVAMIIDRELPIYDAGLIEHLVVDADVPTTWVALCDLDLLNVHTPLLDTAFWLRGLPDRVRHADVPPPPTMTLGADAPSLPGWMVLGRTPEHEIALGAVGRFWTPSIEWHNVDPADFKTFAAPGWGKIVANFSVRAYGERRSLVSYECRTATTDRESRRRFARYWALIRPFVGHIMRATLRQAQTEVEARATSYEIPA